MKNIFFIILFLSGIPLTDAQSNTAVTSGAIGKCAVWDYPYTLYNNQSAAQNINNGVTVTVDQNRNIGAINLAPAGGMNFAGGNGITMSSAGGEINCRWDIIRNQSHTSVNISNPVDVTGTIFTAPYSGHYIWYRGGGWSANTYGAYRNSAINLTFNTGFEPIFFQNEPGTCGSAAGPIMGPSWTNSISYIFAAGTNFKYTLSTASVGSNSSCNNSTINATIGNATFIYDN